MRLQQFGALHTVEQIGEPALFLHSGHNIEVHHIHILLNGAEIRFQELKKNGIIWPREGIDGFAFFRNQPMPNITVSSLKKENDKLKG